MPDETLEARPEDGSEPEAQAQTAASSAPDLLADDEGLGTPEHSFTDEVEVRSSQGEDESQGRRDDERLGELIAAIAREKQTLDSLRNEVAELQGQADMLRSHGPAGPDVAELRAQFVELNDAVLLQQVGIYEYHHPLENADAYKTRLAELRERIREAVRSGNAILASDMFAYNNSLAKGRKMTADFSKLMLRAYNAEADNCVRSLRAGTIASAKKRLETSVETIARLGNMMEMRVSPDYHELRIEELELTADYLFKVQEERERAREERERLREERRAEQELAAERERLAKERSHYANALLALQHQGKIDEAEELAGRLEAIDKAIEFNEYRTANIRAGYVYVISNIGAFGEHIVKIGLTRRLEPMDRIRELGDASVPFPFDVHALYFSDDAVTLENELHAAFDVRRVNHVNRRREFFFATPEDVRVVLAEKLGNLLEFTQAAEASQYFQSRHDWPADALSMRNGLARAEPASQ